MLRCPACAGSLPPLRCPGGLLFRCSECGGRMVTVSLLRQTAPREEVNSLWKAARRSTSRSRRACPSCQRPMSRFRESSEQLEACIPCQTLWFDAGEHTSILPRSVKPIPSAARTCLEPGPTPAGDATDPSEEETVLEQCADRPWKFAPLVLGLPVELERSTLERRPVTTWIVCALVLVTSLLAFRDLPGAIAEFGFVPAAALRGWGLTMVSSFFVHGSAFHLALNVYFMLVFGRRVEIWLGPLPFLLILALSTIAGCLLHAWLSDWSRVPVIGASGGISGILVLYALHFPNLRMAVLGGVVPAWTWIVLWSCLQLAGALQYLGSEDVAVAYGSHVGGALVGLLYWGVKTLPLYGTVDGSSGPAKPNIRGKHEIDDR